MYRYSEQLTNFFLPQLEVLVLQTCGFQFADRDIWRVNNFMKLTWPPRLCDLAPFDSFLCGYVKCEMNADNRETIADRNIA